MITNMEGDTNGIILFKPNLNCLSLEQAWRSGSGKIVRKPLERRQLVDQIIKSIRGDGKIECRANVAMLVLLSAETDMRQALRVRLTKGVTDVPHNIRRVQDYLNKAINGKLKMEDRTLNLKDISCLVSKALDPLKAQLNYPPAMKPKHLYHINDAVRSATDDPACLTYLDAHSVSPLGPVQHETLCGVLRNRFPDQAEAVLDELLDTKTSEMFSLISLDGDRNERVISIASEGGDLITLEAWKFIQLVGKPDFPFELHTFPVRWNPDASQIVRFNQNKTGTIVAKLSSKSSRLYVACLDSNTSTILDKAEFLVDIDYVLCLWIALQRLKQDEVQFRDWSQQSATALHNDPFVGLHYTNQEESYVS